MSKKILELGLFSRRRTDDEKSLPAIASLLDRIVLLLSETAIENEKLQTAEFRKRLDDYRNQISSLSKIEEIGVVAEECLDLCQDYMQRSQAYIQERESEFGKVIDLLRQALAEVAGQSLQFNSQLIASSERFASMIKIQDIYELKKKISDEVTQLRRALQERQKQEAEGFSKLSSRIATLQQKLTKTRKEASIDALTRAANRGCFDETLNKWIQERRDEESFILAMFDLDDFKKINDMHGHAVGDKVLQCASKWLLNDIRSDDFLARFGGDEFAVLVRSIPLSAAEARFTDLLKRAGSAKFEFRKGKEMFQMPFTMSCGLAEYAQGDVPETIFHRADEALYEAKKQGKGKVVVSKLNLTPHD